MCIKLILRLLNKNVRSASTDPRAHEEPKCKTCTCAHEEPKCIKNTTRLRDIFAWIER